MIASSCTAVECGSYCAHDSNRCTLAAENCSPHATMVTSVKIQKKLVDIVLCNSIYGNNELATSAVILNRKNSFMCYARQGLL